MVMNTTTSFTENVKSLIKRIPVGKVATYGQIAMHAGNSRASRQVAWILSSSSQKDNLPWHRIINSKGKISLPIGGGFEEQKGLLEKEGVEFDSSGKVNLEIFLWDPFDEVEKI